MDIDNDVGDGAHDDITGIVISNEGFDSGLITSNTTVNVGGDSYTVTFLGDGTVTVSGVNGSSGAQATGTRIAVFTDQQGKDVGELGDPGYTTLEFTYVSGDTIKVGEFGATVQSDEPVSFNVPISVIDNDGDLVASDDLDITLNPAVTPVVLDLQGDGEVFSSIDAGITYDYNDDGVKSKTAWIAAGAAILAYDANADGIVNNASEFVFGRDGMTDLEALAADHDSNGDGKLDASDASFDSFGLWIDADLDGVSDEGEFVTLRDYGITEIDLVSDGNPFGAADNDVGVAGTTTFTMEDGSTGVAYDAGFATNGNAVDGTMEALLAMGEAESTKEGSKELADASLLRGSQDTPDIKAILEDVMAGEKVDNVIDHFAGNDISGAVLAESVGLIGSNTLTMKIDAGAFAYENSPMADMHEDAAAMAAVGA